jgi:hypothetical protein
MCVWSYIIVYIIYNCVYVTLSTRTVTSVTSGFSEWQSRALDAILVLIRTKKNCLGLITRNEIYRENTYQTQYVLLSFITMMDTGAASVFGCCEECCCEHGGMQFCWSLCCEQLWQVGGPYLAGWAIKDKLLDFRVMHSLPWSWALPTSLWTGSHPKPHTAGWALWPPVRPHSG